MNIYYFFRGSRLIGVCTTWGSTPTLEPSLQDVNASADSFTYRKHHTLPNACIGISELLTRTACAYAQIQNQGLEDLILVVHLAVLQVKKNHAMENEESKYPRMFFKNPDPKLITPNDKYSGETFL